MLNPDDADYEPDASGSDLVADGSTAASGGEKEDSARKRRRTGRSSRSRARRFQHDEGISAGGSPSSVIQPVSEKEMSGYCLHKIINRKQGFLSHGGYNRVLKCLLDDKVVAAKYFYSFDEKREPSRISHEMDMHTLMQRKCNDGTYGKFVSKLIAYGIVKAFGMVLITEYVGEGVTISGSQIIVGSIPVSDAEALSDAALRSLGSSMQHQLNWIHDLGLLHGDVSLRNIRAQKLGERDWQVWWLDFGHSKKSEKMAAFRKEERECRAMFHRRNSRRFDEPGSLNANATGV